MMQTEQLATQLTNSRGRQIKFTPERLQQIRNLVERGKSREEIAELIGVTVGSLQDTCSRFGIDLLGNGMGLLRRGGRHSDNGTSTYTGSRGDDVPLPPINGQSQQNSQSGPVEQPQATTPHEGRARTDEMGLASLDRKSPVDTHIGQRLKEYRQHRGMTVRELADAAHVTPGQISRYEHGRDRISHERVTEFARILRIKSNDLYQPPGSRLRRNHVRWGLTNFVAVVIAEAAALMSSRRKAAAAAADNFEATMVAAVAVAVAAGASAAAAAGAGEKSSLTTSADDTAVDISGSLSGAALKFNPIWHRMAETVTDKERIIVEGKLEISGAVSETIFRADAETTLQLDASDAANALLIMHGANTDTINLRGHYTINAAESQKVAYDPPMSAAGEQASAHSTSAENGFIVSNPFPFTETASGNKDHSAFQFK